MAKTKLTKAELIFGKSNLSIPAFLDDVEFFVKLQQDVLNRVLEIYLGSKYRYYYHDYMDKFSKEIDMSSKDSHRLFHILNFFSYHTVRHHEIDDIITAINELFDDFNAENFLPFLQKLEDKTTQDVLDVLRLIDDEIGTLNPHFDNLTYNIQERIVVQNDKIIKKIPLVLLKIDVSDNSDKSVAIELLEDDLDKLIEGLGEIKKTLNFLSER